MLTIFPAVGFTVMFEKTDYIRVGTSTRPLNDYPAMKAQIWNRLSKQSFEMQTAMENLSLHEALELLDYRIYFQRQEKQSVRRHFLTDMHEGLIPSSIM